ncbi:MAG: hypothetical protein O2873_02795 [Proteobacteria bacterium]|nr:hypothetical protein [Pseudomonadota bacterium]
MSGPHEQPSTRFGSLTQTLPDWIEAQVRALKFFRGVPNAIVRDLVKSLSGISEIRKPEQRHTSRHLLRSRQSHSQRKGKHQEKHNQTTLLATSEISRIIKHISEPEPPMLKPLRCPNLYGDGHTWPLDHFQPGNPDAFRAV